MLMRRFGYAASTLVLLLGLTGCGGTPEPPPAPAQPAGATDPNAVPPGMEPADPKTSKK